MVDRQSAIHKRSRDPEDIYSIDEDHSAMVKFPPGDLNYLCVLDCLEVVLSALETYQLRKLSQSQIPEEGTNQESASTTSAELLEATVIHGPRRRGAVAPEGIMPTRTRDRQALMRRSYNFIASAAGFISQDHRSSAPSPVYL